MKPPKYNLIYLSMSKKRHNFALVLNKRHEDLHLHIALMLSFVYLAKIDNDYEKEHKDSLYSH